MAFNITREAYEKLIAANRYDLILTAYVNESGYAGILSNGNIVDRRIFQEAIPVPENAFMGIPKSKDIVSPEQMDKRISDLEARLKEAEEKSIKYDSLKQHCDIISGELNWEREVVVKDLDQRLSEAVELILELKTAVYSHEKRSWEEAGANENELEELLSTSPLIVKSDAFLTKEKTK